MNLANFRRRGGSSIAIEIPDSGCLIFVIHHRVFLISSAKNNSERSTLYQMRSSRDALVAIGHRARHTIKRRSRSIFLLPDRPFTSTTKSTSYRVWQYPVSSEGDGRDHGVLYLGSGEKGSEWKLGIKPTKEISDVSTLSRNVISHFLPAKHPHSVAPGYLKFASYSFVASVAGSASMVLSTQTLLLAVGVVGSNAQAGIMAGAFNWVMKDFVGQVGGVLFASQMGKTRAFDADPKYVVQFSI
eukprot:scaffold25670_cov127-Cylindrotheca_fusiformis.AAC.2